MRVQECHIDVKEDQLTKLMVAEGFVHGAEVIMRAETFKRCLLHVSTFLPGCLLVPLTYRTLLLAIDLTATWDIITACFVWLSRMWGITRCTHMFS